MENIIIVLNNRNNAMQLATYLKKSGVRCKIQNTPRELSISCGLSIYINNRDLPILRNIIMAYNYASFVKIYQIISNGIVKKYIPI